ncbi:hypothetical protein C8R46DRAFT_1048395 [Mycena filopes]|nr:hypothetical protein C8R46DRAFT_1048395 [Mycena filopes]
MSLVGVYELEYHPAIHLDVQQEMTHHKPSISKDPLLQLQTDVGELAQFPTFPVVPGFHGNMPPPRVVGQVCSSQGVKILGEPYEARDGLTNSSWVSETATRIASQWLKSRSKDDPTHQDHLVQTYWAWEGMEDRAFRMALSDLRLVAYCNTAHGRAPSSSPGSQYETILENMSSNQITSSSVLSCPKLFLNVFSRKASTVGKNIPGVSEVARL